MVKTFCSGKMRREITLLLLVLLGRGVNTQTCINGTDNTQHLCGNGKIQLDVFGQPGPMGPTGNTGPRGYRGYRGLLGVTVELGVKRMEERRGEMEIPHSLQKNTPN